MGAWYFCASPKLTTKMKNRIFLLIALCLTAAHLFAQTSKLLGVCTRDSLLQDPYKSWYQPNYDTYEPAETAIAQLKKLPFKDLEIEIFFGTWCGDTKREMPRFLKILDQIGFDESKVKFIAVNTGEEYKQSPGGETVGKGIYRVATFIVLKNGKEINRIVEHPVKSLELDLLDILTNKGYQPNFYAYKFIDQWLADGSLTNPNVSNKGLAKSLKPLLISPSELNACGHVLATQNKMPEAIAVFRMNNYIFYDNIDSYLSLASSLYRNEKYQEALTVVESTFNLNKEEDKWKKILDMYYSIRKSLE